VICTATVDYGRAQLSEGKSGKGWSHHELWNASSRQPKSDGRARQRGGKQSGLTRLDVSELIGRSCAR